MATPTASDAFLGSLTSMTNEEDLQGILGAQGHMLRRFEKTNEMLSNFNSLSNQRYATVNQHFTAHTHLLLEMKSDLDAIFRRLRQLKAKLSKDYPRAFAAASKDAKPLDLGEEEGSDEAPDSKREMETKLEDGISSDGPAQSKTVPEGEESHSGRQHQQLHHQTDSASGETPPGENKEPQVYLVD